MGKSCQMLIALHRKSLLLHLKARNFCSTPGCSVCLVVVFVNRGCGGGGGEQGTRLCPHCAAGEVATPRFCVHRRGDDSLHCTKSRGGSRLCLTLGMPKSARCWFAAFPCGTRGAAWLCVAHKPPDLRPLCFVLRGAGVHRAAFGSGPEISGTSDNSGRHPDVPKHPRHQPAPCCRSAV